MELLKWDFSAEPWMKQLMLEEETVPLTSSSQDYEEAFLSLRTMVQSQALTLTFTLKRNVVKEALQIIGPPALLVVVSWVSIFSLLIL